MSREGTSPGMGEGRTMHEQLSRKPGVTGGNTGNARLHATHRDDAQGCANVTVDMDVESDCRELEPRREQRPRRRRYESMDGRDRVASGTKTESDSRLHGRRR